MVLQSRAKPSQHQLPFLGVSLWVLFGVAALGCLAALFYHNVHKLDQPDQPVSSSDAPTAAVAQQAFTSYEDICGKIGTVIVEQIRLAGVAADQIKTQTDTRNNESFIWTSTKITAPAPEALVPVEFAEALQRSLSAYGARVVPRIGVSTILPLAVYYQNLQCAEIELQKDMNPFASAPEQQTKEPEKLMSPQAPPAVSSGPESSKPNEEARGLAEDNKGAPRVAIIVDDGGNGGPVTEAFLAMDKNLTLAIMPDGRHAAEIAKRAEDLGFEVILHLPMESELGREWLNRDMSQEAIRKKTEEAISRVPGLVGINSHMGSLFTKDQAAVDKFINVIKDKPYYFVDSRTTGKSVAYKTAQKAGIRSNSRDVFIDINVGKKVTSEYMHGQFDQLLRIAKKRGQAIAICHFTKTTAAVMPELLPLLKQNGIQLVHASELVH